MAEPVKVAVFFTKNSGEPATGLTLADISIYLVAQERESNATTILWNTKHPVKEVEFVGAYTLIYPNGDLNLYDYFARGTYTGADVLDQDHVTGTVSTEPERAEPGAIPFIYTLTSTVDGSPIADADVWVTSDINGDNTIAAGRTNQNGKVTFYLDAGTIYVWRQKTGFSFPDNPDRETVSP